MQKNSSEYWENRIANRVWSTYNSMEEKNRMLLEMYQDATKDIASELYDLGTKLGTDGVLSRSDMYKQDRLTKLKKSMEGKIEKLGQDTEAFTKDNMMNGYRQVNKTVVDQIGEIDFAMPNNKVMEEMIDHPWLGSNFSDRLWKNAELLTVTLNDVLVRGIEQGKTTTEMAIEISNSMQAGFNITHRLVRTETMHYLNSAALQGYKDSGIRKVQYWAAEDERTCDECGDNGYHGKIFNIEKTPILPLHPNCRCTYIPVVELQKDTENVTLEEGTHQWTKDAKAELLKEEKHLSVRKKETTLVYDPKGKLMFRKHGSENEVAFTVAEFLKLRGNVVTHNHPTGGSFSVQDVMLLKRSKMAELRVSTDRGVYYMRPPRKWPNGLKDILEEIRTEIAPKYQNQFLSGKINKVERYQLWSDEVNRIFSDRYGLDYGREDF